MERYFIGVDLGGTETKAGIYTAEGREIGVSSQVLPLLSPCLVLRTRHGGVMEGNVPCHFTVDVREQYYCESD